MVTIYINIVLQMAYTYKFMLVSILPHTAISQKDPDNVNVVLFLFYKLRDEFLV